MKSARGVQQEETKDESKEGYQRGNLDRGRGRGNRPQFRQNHDYRSRPESAAPAVDVEAAKQDAVLKEVKAQLQAKEEQLRAKEQQIAILQQQAWSQQQTSHTAAQPYTGNYSNGRGGTSNITE